MLRRLLAAGPLLALAIACASPTLPLPPPEAPTVAPGSDADHVKLTGGAGGAEAGAIIVIVNNAAPDDLAVSGARVDGNGAWDATVYAHGGDVLAITQESGDTRSPPATVKVPGR